MYRRSAHMAFLLFSPKDYYSHFNTKNKDCDRKYCRLLKRSFSNEEDALQQIQFSELKFF